MLVMLNGRCAAWGLENEEMNDLGEKGVGGWLVVCLSLVCSGVVDSMLVARLAFAIVVLSRWGGGVVSRALFQGRAFWSI